MHRTGRPWRSVIGVAFLGLVAGCGGATAGDPCDGVDCGQHGLCATRGGAAFCLCETGFHFDGAECVDEDPCTADASCLAAHRECGSVGGEVSCGDCLGGYHEEGELCVGDTSCDGGATCNDHGTCDDSSGVVVCVCATGYGGDRCETCGAGFQDYGDGVCRPSDPCAIDAACAAAHRQCQNDQGSASCGGCLGGYHEQAGVCVPDEACAGRATCNDRGDCDDATGAVVCSCDGGYDGPRCELCAPGFGDYGDGQCRPVDPCAGDTACAAAHRTCVNAQGVAACGDCLPAYHAEYGACVADCPSPVLTPIAPLPVPRWGHGATEVRDGVIFLLGGTSGTGQFATYSQTVFAYDVHADAYTDLGAVLPYGMRLYPASVAWGDNDQLYAPPTLGTSHNNGWGTHSRVVEIDLLGTPPAAVERASYSGNRWGAVTANGGDGYLYFFSSYNGAPLYDIWRYHPVTNALELVPGALPGYPRVAQLASDGIVYLPTLVGSDHQLIAFDPVSQSLTTMPALMPCDAWTRFWEEPLGVLWGICGLPGELGFYTYDLATGDSAYTHLTDLPGGAFGSISPEGVTVDFATGEVYFFGGSSAGSPVDSAFRLECVGPPPW